MKQKILGTIASLMGLFVTAVCIHNHCWGFAVLFGFITAAVVYNFFGTGE
jgi:hypothetical protein